MELFGILCFWVTSYIASTDTDENWSIDAQAGIGLKSTLTTRRNQDESLFSVFHLLNKQQTSLIFSIQSLKKTTTYSSEPSQKMHVQVHRLSFIESNVVFSIQSQEKPTKYSLEPSHKMCVSVRDCVNLKAFFENIPNNLNSRERWLRAQR